MNAKKAVAPKQTVFYIVQPSKGLDEAEVQRVHDTVGISHLHHHRSAKDLSCNHQMYLSTNEIQESNESGMTPKKKISPQEIPL